MPTRRTHLLSIALTPTTAEIVEAKRSDKSVKIVRRSTHVFAERAGLESPAALGSALAEHLDEQGYGTRHAVIGLCSRWVLARHKQAPPADPDAMRGIVNLQIEREFAGGSADMVFDYLLSPSSEDTSKAKLLLAGVQRSVLQQAKQAALAAGLKVELITATPLAAVAGYPGTVVAVEQGVATVLQVVDRAVTGLSSFAANPAAPGDPLTRERFIADLSRGLLQLPGSTNEAAMVLLLPTSVSEGDAQALTELACERFGTARYVQQDAAERLAEHATNNASPIINFLDSRLAPPKPQRFSSTAQWLIRAAVIVLLIVGTIGYLWFDATSSRNALQADYDAIKDKAEELNQRRSDTRLAGRWYDKRPPALDCLLELTRTFPTEGEIRVETLTLRDDMTGIIECAAEDRATLDRYFSQMKRSEALKQVNLGSVRPAGGRSTWIDFPIAFEFDAKAERGEQ